MLNCAKLERQTRVFQSLTGLSLAAFAQLLPAFEQAYAVALDTADTQRGQARERQRGGGRKATLATLADKLVFILFYFRLYPTQAAQGFFFGLSQGQACTWIHRLTPLLNQALGYEQQLPARQPVTVTQVLAACPDLAFIVDGTERPIQRPKDAERQRQYYSGKKKRHTVKNIVITHQDSRKIKALGPTCEGKKHDKAAVDETDFLFPPGSRLLHAGCGSGQVDADLHEDMRITALDISLPALRLYRANNNQQVSLNLGFNGAPVLAVKTDLFGGHVVRQLERRPHCLHGILHPDVEPLLRHP